MPRKAKQQREDYRGILKTPIRIPKPLPRGPSILSGDVSEKARNTHAKAKCKQILSNGIFIEKEKQRKLKALARHHGISFQNDDKWERLAYEIATDHVPGFKVVYEDDAGRDEFWSEFVLARLYFDVQKKLDAGKPTVTMAVQSLLRQEPWNQVEFKGKTVGMKTLQNRYAQAKQSAVIQTYFNICNDDRVSSNAVDFETMVYRICPDEYLKN